MNGFAPNQSGAIFGATPGIARNMQAAPEPLAGGDLNGTASTSILFSHAGTAASFLGLPRNLVGSSMGIANATTFQDFAVDYHPVEPEPEGELGDMIASGELDELVSLTEPEPLEAPIGEAGEAVEPAEPEPEPEPPKPEHKHKHKGRHV